MKPILPIFIRLALCLLTVSTYAQSDKTTVGILPFSYVNSSDVIQHVETINELVESAFVKANRQTVVSRMNFTDLKDEVDRNKGTEFIDGKAVTQGRQFGAQFLVKGRVLAAGGSRTYSSSSNSYSYSGKVGLAVKVLDVETGQVVASEVIQGTAGSSLGSLLSGGNVGLGASSTEEAVDMASRNLAKKVYEWVKGQFSAKITIVKVVEQDDRRGVQSVLIAGGSDIGLKNGSRLKVVEFEQMEIDGRTETREIEIGQLQVDKVEGPRFSICKVQRGNKELGAKIEQKASIKAVTVK